MIVTFDFRPERKPELLNFADRTRTNYAPYVALLQQSLGITQQRWLYYTPKASAPPDFPHKLVIWFMPDDPAIWSNFLKIANGANPPLVAQNALRTLPVGTASGPDFRPVWPDPTIYDCETLFSY